MNQNAADIENKKSVFTLLKNPLPKESTMLLLYPPCYEAATPQFAVRSELTDVIVPRDATGDMST